MASGTPVSYNFASMPVRGVDNSLQQPTTSQATAATSEEQPTDPHATAEALRSPNATHARSSLSPLSKRCCCDHTQTKKRKKAIRVGSPNYNNDDVTALLDLVEKEEPLGANHWALVASQYADWASTNDRPIRDQDSLKKIEKLSNMKKKTGDPSCPTPVRRAKHIARGIQKKCAAITLGESNKAEEELGPSVGTLDGSNNAADTPSESEMVGTRSKKRKTAATEMPTKARAEVILLEQLGTMSQHVRKISQAIKGNTSQGITKKDIVEIVREEVAESLKPANQLLLKMNSMLEDLTSKERS